jgi:hypothetical protein
MSSPRSRCRDLTVKRDAMKERMRRLNEPIPWYQQDDTLIQEYFSLEAEITKLEHDISWYCALSETDNNQPVPLTNGTSWIEMW